MSATLTAVLTLIGAVLNDAPQWFAAIQNLLDGHPANPSNGGQSLATTVTTGTQAAENALHNTVLK